MSDEDLHSRFRRSPLEPAKPTAREAFRQPKPRATIETPTTAKPNILPSRHATNPSPVKPPKKPKRSIKKLILLIVAVLVVVGLATGGTLFYASHKSSKNDKKDVLGQATQGVVIPLYYPKNLPAGYTDNNDSKALKENVFYSSVNGPKNTKFYITQQPIPDNFNFTDFSKKFSNPDSFNTSAGDAIVGQVGANTIGSIKTNKNTWVLINSLAGNTTNQVEVVARSLEPVK